MRAPWTTLLIPFHRETLSYQIILKILKLYILLKPLNNNFTNNDVTPNQNILAKSCWRYLNIFIDYIKLTTSF